MDRIVLHLSIEQLQYYCAWSLERHAAPINPSLLDLLAEVIRHQLDADVGFRPALEYALNGYRLYDDEATGIPWREMYSAVLGKLYSDHAFQSNAWKKWVAEGTKRSPRRSAIPAPTRQLPLF